MEKACPWARSTAKLKSRGYARRSASGPFSDPGSSPGASTTVREVLSRTQGLNASRRGGSCPDMGPSAPFGAGDLPRPATRRRLRSPGSVRDGPDGKWCPLLPMVLAWSARDGVGV